MTTSRPTSIIRVILAILLIAIIVLASVFNRNVAQGFREFLDWVSNSIVLGAFVYVGVYFLATVCFLPGSILTLGAGFVFSLALKNTGIAIVVGTLIVFLGASAGAIAAFFLGRTIFREPVEAWIQRYPTFTAIDKVLKEQGLKMVLLLRLSPLIPFNAFVSVFAFFLLYSTFEELLDGSHFSQASRLHDWMHWITSWNNCFCQCWYYIRISC